MIKYILTTPKEKIPMNANFQEILNRLVQQSELTDSEFVIGTNRQFLELEVSLRLMQRSKIDPSEFAGLVEGYNKHNGYKDQFHQIPDVTLAKVKESWEKYFETEFSEKNCESLILGRDTFTVGVRYNPKSNGHAFRHNFEIVLYAQFKGWDFISIDETGGQAVFATKSVKP
ncbi:MAG: hypothetical protein ACRCXZ_02760 [Patescibacteria group bacterium]